MADFRLIRAKCKRFLFDGRPAACRKNSTGVSMTAILDRRRALHRHITSTRQQNEVLQSQLAYLQALANIGTVASMIAHEINNILTPLTSYAQLALNNPADKALTQKSLEKTVHNAERAAKILESLLSLANGEKQHKKNCGLEGMLADIFTCISRDFSKDKITVDIQIPQGLSIRGVPVQIQQVLMNLILNARDAMLAKGGRLAISALDGPEAVQIEVADTGSGIPKENIGRIFDPFFTTKNDSQSKAHSGSGMGLAFCRYIVDAHNGNITVSSRAGEGTSFIITLPKS
jgi:signal transduction histidine kinase